MLSYPLDAATGKADEMIPTKDLMKTIQENGQDADDLRKKKISKIIARLDHYERKELIKQLVSRRDIKVSIVRIHSGEEIKNNYLALDIH